MSCDKEEKVLADPDQQWGVNSTIHPEDFIFQFLLGQPDLGSRAKALEYYFKDGANSANMLRDLLSDVCNIKDRPFSMLEFASGYGCVTRHYKNVLPLCSCTSCDIHPQAVQFIEEVLKTDTILSASNPEDMVAPRQYDVIFALSFFSHMPKTTFSRWMNRLASHLVSGGYLIFTTHGLISHRSILPDTKFDEDGFFFLPSSEQKDLDTEEDGAAMVKPQYVFSRIFENPSVQLKYFWEGRWWGHQDLYILGKQ